MDTNELAQTILARLGGGDNAAHCRMIGARFRDALEKANPDLTEAQILAYEAAFELEIPGLSGAVRDAQAKAVAAALRPQDIEVLSAAVAFPQLEALLSLLHRLRPVLAGSAQEIIRSRGVEAHARSAEKAFSTA